MDAAELPLDDDTLRHTAEKSEREIRKVIVDVKRCRLKGLRKEPFFATVALGLEIWVCDNIRGRPVKTAAVAGPNLYVNPDWYTGLTTAQRIGLVMHEVMHRALGHDLRRGKKNPTVWNHACDYVINNKLLKFGFELPEGGLVDKKFEDWAEELGANAVVGVDLDYESFGQTGGMMMVSVSGTAVKTRRSGD